MLIDFSGKVLEAVNWTDGIKTTRTFDYDHAGRILKAYHQINQQPKVTLSANEFNSLGQEIGRNIHSVNGSAYLQSLDYATDIRGWLTRFNNTNIADNKDPGDPAPDYFGIEYARSSSFGSGNTARYDGFFSAIKWKNDIGQKERLYNFSYDALGRLLVADYKVKDNKVIPIENPTPGWNKQLGRFSEDNLTYDFNGNIISLNRNNTAAIDELTYVYNEGNQLSSVTDDPANLEDEKGFKDGNTSGDDYDYDANGNLTEDNNKGIDLIEYNHLNLPTKVVFDGGEYIDYTYTASGTRLRAQYFTSTGQSLIDTEYIGGFVYVNDALQFFSHEEGRIVPSPGTNRVSSPTREANGLEGFSANGNVTITSESLNGETYAKVVCNQSTSTPGVWPIGGEYNVSPGESYSFKVLGYQTVGTSASLLVSTPSGDLLWPGVTLPIGAANENYVTSTFTVPAGVSKIKIGVLWNGAAVGNTLFINRVGLYKTDFEYQYFLTDHQGSPRVVLQTSPATITFSATMESESSATENEQFLNLSPMTRETNLAANATPGGNEAIRMTMATRIGPAKSIKVLPGDVINGSVQAYYTATTGYSAAATSTMITALATILSGGAPIVDQAISNAYNNPTSNVNIALSGFQGSGRPSAYLNYILFDENYVPLKAKSFPVLNSPNVRHTVAFDAAITAEELGYLFVYLSYDNENAIPVYFDDLKITVTESPVIQVNAYYPFGLNAYAWTRDGETENKYLYQGKELDSHTGWQDFHARQYDGAVARFWSIDPRNQFASGYTGMGNLPVMGVDPDGEFFFVPIIVGAVIGGVVGGMHASQSGDYSVAGGIWRGALIGGLAGAGGAGISAAGSGAMLAGAVGGAIGGSGFAGLQSNWNANAMLRGGLIGAASGFVGGGFASAIGGGGGAFIGGIASDVTGQLLSTGEVDMLRAGIAGVTAFGMYHGMSAIGYHANGKK